MLVFSGRSLGQPYKGSNIYRAASKYLGYVSDGDTNGLFYYLGTNFGTGTWTNPHTAGRVTIGGFNSSNVADIGAGTAAGVVNRDNTDDNRTNNAPGSYWKVSLNGQRLAVTRYTFRARPSGSGTASNVAQWKLQGSADGTTWVDLDSRTGVTYAVDNEWKSYAVSGAAAYAYIRMLHQANVTGANNFFFLSELELYGLFYSGS